jgi:hypothetical protein
MYIPQKHKNGPIALSHGKNDEVANACEFFQNNGNSFLLAQSCIKQNGCVMNRKKCFSACSIQPSQTGRKGDLSNTLIPDQNQYNVEWYISFLKLSASKTIQKGFK